ncbi:MAG: adenosylhomocysteinase [Firmicutes bacterium]|nr:adenosylhomocysteinase [Bacillota bacterium]MBQ1430862.1 adenosylhomocysteinase [Bacillota bacterium]MBQ1630249.1 adenosylhomocysteinase [Bacillota bacterium]MBQ1825602.1 adenosylhomocysteinase [Bacillota bacterium]MBQ2304719.1 adenosylhomocysteinase [Bacillota bacterium]
MEYDIRDIGLAPYGHEKIEWVRDHMPLLRSLEERFEKEKPFEGVKVSLSVHLEAKTAYLCKVMAAGGAQMSVTGSNILSTQDDICAALVEDGISVFAYHDATDEEYFRHLEKCLEVKPNIIIDDGCDLVTLIHNKRPDLAEEVWGGCEETTTGIIRLRALDKAGLLMFPMMAVNDADMKHLFDNRYGTGQSTWDAIMRNTNLIVAGKTVVVAGYGWVSRGIAMRAASLGANVIVTEIDPVKAIEAKMDGFTVMKMDDAAPLGDIFCTATGCVKSINTDHMMTMKNGAILTNSGHFNCEVDMEGLYKLAVSHHERRHNVEGFILPNGREVDVIADGRLVNIAGADGHPAEIMDMSFAVQLYGAMYIMEHRNELPKHLLKIPEEIDKKIASDRLAAWGIEIDTLTDEQSEYLNSWKL